MKLGGGGVGLGGEVVHECIRTGRIPVKVCTKIRVGR